MKIENPNPDVHITREQLGQEDEVKEHQAQPSPWLAGSGENALPRPDLPAAEPAKLTTPEVHEGDRVHDHLQQPSPWLK